MGGGVGVGIAELTRGFGGVEDEGRLTGLGGVEDEGWLGKR